MHSLKFTTGAPYDHVVRVLDLLRKMGFSLHSLNVAALPANWTVDLIYSVEGALSAETFQQRARLLRGLTVLEVGPGMSLSWADAPSPREAVS
jgi:acetolactate synthase regulatory subunit